MALQEYYALTNNREQLENKVARTPDQGPITRENCPARLPSDVRHVCWMCSKELNLVIQACSENIPNMALAKIEDEECQCNELV